MTHDIVGREDELRAVEAFVGGDGNGPSALILEGDAGVGKSTLWTAAVTAAAEVDVRPLTARPAELERGLPHVVLADLLEGVVDEVLPALSPPRRRALEGALLLGQAPDDEIDPRALAVAVRTCLRMLAAERPLLVAVDDSHWLDPSSARVLAFALRRLGEDRILLLLARRLGENGADLAVERAFGPEAVARLRVGPLTTGALSALLQRRLGRRFMRPTLLRLHEISGGNPFYALELARGAGDAAGGASEPFPVPDTLEQLVGARLAGLAGATREALLLTAAHGRPSPALLRAARIDQAQIDDAVATGVVELSEGAVRFTHPLLASILYRGVPDGERRRAHRRLAAVVDDPLERVRHLALASDAPDEDVAASLEELAAAARARGTSVAAADLAEHAVRLTPTAATADRDRRGIAAARAHLEGGDVPRAESLAQKILARADVPLRAHALVLLSDVATVGRRWSEAIELRREALAAASQLPALQAEIHESLGHALWFTEGAAAADEHAARALELADSLGDDALRAGALSVLAVGRFRAGYPEGLQLVEQARVAADGVDPRRRRRVLLRIMHPLVWAHRLDTARAILETLDAEWRDRDELTTADVLWWLAMTELRAGRFTVAAEHAERARQIWSQYAIDEPEETSGAAWLVAVVAAHRGDLQTARELIEPNLALTEGHALLHSGDEGVIGLVELWGGRPREAVSRFASADEERRSIGVAEPAKFWWRADYAEALLEVGETEAAAELVAGWEEQAARLGREAVLAQATRCRGLVAAARGDVDAALAELAQAVVQHDAVGDAFSSARALLALGVVRRRAQRRREAREAITAALAGFEECGAAGWAERARSELGRIGGRQARDGLTPAELRIAALVGQGRTNREVAAALFLTERTVATALTRVYRKLGVRSRAELVHQLAGARPDAEQANT